MLKKGDVIKGRYEIQRLIGKGGMSRVFLAADLKLTNKLWAVKEVDRRSTDPMGRPIEQSLDGEADLLSKLDHPRIVDIVDIEKTDGYIYVVMDHVEGESLDKVVRSKGPQSEEDVQKWMLQICDALGYLHRQNPAVIYRDMKPNNVMLHPDGYVKLIDLGVAKEYKDGKQKDTVAFGTVGYAAPEQYGTAQSDARTDIYGIGATMWHLLAGEAPPNGMIPKVTTVNPSVGEGFSDVIIPKCTEFDPAKRYQSCEELAADLELYHELTQEYRAKQKRKVFSFAVTGVLAIVLMLSGFGMLAWRNSLVTEQYEYQLALGDDQRRANPADAENFYLAAIELDSLDTRAYEGLIECYKVDGVFTEDEKKQFNNVYQTNLAELKRNVVFPDLAYKIGVLYRYYYAFGSDADVSNSQSARIKASAEYFSEAVKSSNSKIAQISQVYSDIARFSTEIAASDYEVKSSDETNQMYLGFWDSLKKLSDEFLDNGDIPEKIRMETAVYLTSSLENYMDKFKAAEVPSREVEKVRGDIDKALENLKGKMTSQEDENMRADTLSRLNNEVVRKLSTVYSNNTAKSK